VSRLELSDGFFRIDSFGILSSKIVSKQAEKEGKSKKAKGKSKEINRLCLMNGL